LSPTMYELDHIHEYNSIRMGCGLFDISPLFKYFVRGRDAETLLNRIVTRDISKCRVGQVIYTAWCDDAGKIIDDGTVARLSEDSFRMTAAIPTLYWLQDNAFGLEVEIEDASDAYGGLALQGPTSRDLLQQITDADLSKLGYFRIVDTKVGGVPASVSRTGYTGDLGYEIFVTPQNAETLWDALVAKGIDYKMQPAGNVALDMTRIEAGLLLIDVDFQSAAKAMFEVEKTSPYDLGLDWMVKLEKGFFVGQEALRREKARGPAWTTVGLEVDVQGLEKLYSQFSMPLHLPYQSWNTAVPVYADDEKRQHIGRATSGTWSPVLKRYVVIARVKPQHAQLGRRIYLEETIEAQRFAAPATVVPMPFFDPPRKKA
ncbi:MAG: aminomethyltransferase family protein, partial [Myxococcales bacterium]|nr:aminomethyltransferase family protein [Myxococcales bacterium]